MAVNLVMYGRSACHLCQDMQDALTKLQEEYDFSLEIRDIDSKPDWFRKYSQKIPVLMAEDTEICHFHLDPVALQAYFSRQTE